MTEKQPTEAQKELIQQTSFLSFAILDYLVEKHDLSGERKEAMESDSALILAFKQVRQTVIECSMVLEALMVLDLNPDFGFMDPALHTIEEES